MHKLLLAALVSLFAANLVLAETPATAKKDVTATAPAEKKAPAGERKLTPQQGKMKACNGEAAEKKLKGAERKAFMKECLSGGKK